MMKQLFLAVCFCLLLGLPTNSALAQCCLGAQDLTATSRGGRYRVDAKSLTGTGPRAHGPYHFRFSFLEKSAHDQFQIKHEFELRWEINAHFNMRIMVSPTGNGFALIFPRNQLVFYGPAGEELYEFPRDRLLALGDDGYTISAAEIIKYGKSGLAVDDAKLFLPLAGEATKSLDYQSIWYLFADPQRIRRQFAAMSDAAKDLKDGSEATRTKARELLLRHGAAAIAVLDKELEHSQDEATRQRLTSLLEELAPWRAYSGPDGWRDLVLTTSFLYYPDSRVRRRARVRLVGWLGEKVKPMSDGDLHDWVMQNAERLSWSSESKAYVLREQ